MNNSFSDLAQKQYLTNFDLRVVPMQLQVPKPKNKFISLNKREDSEEKPTESNYICSEKHFVLSNYNLSLPKMFKKTSSKKIPKLSDEQTMLTF